MFLRSLTVLSGDSVVTVTNIAPVTKSTAPSAPVVVPRSVIRETTPPPVITAPILPAPPGPAGQQQADNDNETNNNVPAPPPAAELPAPAQPIVADRPSPARSTQIVISTQTPNSIGSITVHTGEASISGIESARRAAQSALESERLTSMMRTTGQDPRNPGTDVLGDRTSTEAAAPPMPVVAAYREAESFGVKDGA